MQIRNLPEPPEMLRRAAFARIKHASMAKAGEGDARWIVADRADGTNVHNWHWAEKDVTLWAKSRLTTLLGDLELTRGAASLIARTDSAVSVTGDAVVNNRKNKLIPAYELQINGSWSGRLKRAPGEELSVSGQWKIPYLAEENADEDPELQVTTVKEDDAHRQSKALVLETGKQVIYSKVREFVKEISIGGPIQRDGNAKEPTSSKEKTEDQKNSTVATQQSKPLATSSGRQRTFSSTEKFYARPADIFECFTDARKIQAFTQSPAKAEAKEGGAFEMFGGSVTGTYRQLQKHTKIVLDWRFRNWQERDVSKVTIRFEEPELGTTVVSLTHSGIPEEDEFGNEDVFETTASGWKQQIFHKIRAVFGYGLGL